MKIITNDAAYLQKNDIILMKKYGMDIPNYILAEDINGKLDLCNNYIYDFIKYTDLESIEYLKSVDWIVDYNSVKDASIEELTNCADMISKEFADVYASISESTKEERLEAVNKIRRCKELDYKFNSINSVIGFKQGNSIFDLPCGVSYPEGYKVSKVKRLINKIFVR